VCSQSRERKLTNLDYADDVVFMRDITDELQTVTDVRKMSNSH